MDLVDGALHSPDPSVPAIALQTASGALVVVRLPPLLETRDFASRPHGRFAFWHLRPWHPEYRPALQRGLPLLDSWTFVLTVGVGRSASLRVPAGLKHTSPVTPRTGHLMRFATEVRDDLPGPATRGALAAVIAFVGRAHLLTATSRPSPTGRSDASNSGISTIRALSARAILI
jgi:hypothetical protein